MIDLSAFEGLNAHEKLVVCGNLILLFWGIVEVNTGQSAVCVNLHSLALNETSSKCLGTVVLQVKYHLVPAFVQLERHRTLKGLDAGD